MLPQPSAKGSTGSGGSTSDLLPGLLARGFSSLSHGSLHMTAHIMSSNRAYDAKERMGSRQKPQCFITYLLKYPIMTSAVSYLLCRAVLGQCVGDLHGEVNSRRLGSLRAWWRLAIPSVERKNKWEKILIEPRIK